MALHLIMSGPAVRVAHLSAGHPSSGRDLHVIARSRCREVRRRRLGFQWAVASSSLAVALTGAVSPRVAAQESRAPVLHERVWSIPQDVISQPDVADRLGRFEKDPSSNYNIYDKRGERVGVGKPRPDGSIDLYDTRGRQGLELRPERPRRK